MAWYVLLFVTACSGLAGACGRHIQGGAGPRWEAMVIYTVCCVSSVGVYLLPFGWGDATLVGLIALFYVNMTMAQKFDNLWLGAIRYCVPLFVLALITGCAWALPFCIPIFFALKWAKSAKDPADPHMYFEYVLGFFTGAAWGLAPLLRGW